MCGASLYTVRVNRRAFIYSSAFSLVGCSALSVASEAAGSLGAIAYVQGDGL
jgi:hypothetical protein